MSYRALSCPVMLPSTRRALQSGGLICNRIPTPCHVLSCSAGHRLCWRRNRIAPSHPIMPSGASHSRDTSCLPGTQSATSRVQQATKRARPVAATRKGLRRPVARTSETTDAALASATASALPAAEALPTAMESFACAAAASGPAKSQGLGFWISTHPELASAPAKGLGFRF
jgi:hypothetical protein